MVAPLGFYDVATDEATVLAAAIGEEARALSTGDCISACNALASMRRSVARLCALDPGSRCKDAQATLASSEEKVRASCPACATGTLGPTPHDAPQANSALQPFPARQSAGGCRNCSSSPSSGGDFGACALAMAWLLSRLRRRF